MTPALQLTGELPHKSTWTHAQITLLPALVIKSEITETKPTIRIQRGHAILLCTPLPTTAHYTSSTFTLLTQTRGLADTPPSPKCLWSKLTML